MESKTLQEEMELQYSINVTSSNQSIVFEVILYQMVLLWDFILVLNLVIMARYTGDPPANEALICFVRIALLDNLGVIVVTFTFAISIYCVWNHCTSNAKELRALEKFRAEFKQSQISTLSIKILQVNDRDKPLQTTAEERTAKSLAIIYLVQFAATVITFVFATGVTHSV